MKIILLFKSQRGQEEWGLSKKLCLVVLGKVCEALACIRVTDNGKFLNSLDLIHTVYAVTSVFHCLRL